MTIQTAYIYAKIHILFLPNHAYIGVKLLVGPYALDIYVKIF
jgi:hypothetical protein